MGTGHFTQMVWKSCKSYGIYAQTCNVKGSSMKCAVALIILSIIGDRSYLVAIGYIYWSDKTLQRVLGFIYKSVYNRLV